MNFDHQSSIGSPESGAEDYSAPAKIEKPKVDPVSAEKERLFRKIFDSLEKEAKELQDLANEDDLTGLDNKRSLGNKLDLLTEQLRRGQIKSLHALFLDIDKFKDINTEHGYETGNIAIQVFAERLKAFFRGSDVIARYGGDEFIIILVDTDAETIKTRLETIVRPSITEPFEVESEGISGGKKDQPILKLNMSAGLTRLTLKDLKKEGSGEKIIKKIAETAGAAVRKAKEMGRGGTVEFKALQEAA